MKLATSFLLPALIGAAAATSDATVYIFDKNGRPTINPPTLTPEQARLVLAQRLGASQYHGIGDASETTLSYINTLGGVQETLFKDSVADKAAELILIVDGGYAEEFGVELAHVERSFFISTPPSMTANKMLVSDMQRQIGQSDNCPLEKVINPFEKDCWNGRSNIIHYDSLSEKASFLDLPSAHRRWVQFVKEGAMNVVLVIMPTSSRTSKSSTKPYGSYELPSQVSMGKVRRQAAEEPITEAPVASTPPTFSMKQVQSSNSSDNSTLKPLPKLPPLCYASQDACMSSTNNCTGHGTCYKKYSTTKSACFTCGCRATNETFQFGEKPYYTTVNWGGSACHKRDVSSPFWLISIFTVVLVGTVSWGIGLMYSIGEEKLPGVIGAGVSSKTR